MRIAAVQHDIVWEDPPATLAHLDDHVVRAAATGADLVVLTEMFATGFSMATDRTAQPEDGQIVTWMRRTAATHGIHLAGSVAIDPGDGGMPVNRLLVVGPERVEARYDKIHPFSYSGEHERFRAGSEPTTVTLGEFRFGLTVCFDLRFADLYWQLAADVDAYLVVANWPASRREHWQRLLPARAIENQAYVIGVNRVGRGGSLDYLGDSCIIDPLGETLAAASRVETILVADLDRAKVADTRTSYPFMADRR